MSEFFRATHAGGNEARALVRLSQIAAVRVDQADDVALLDVLLNSGKSISWAYDGPKGTFVSEQKRDLDFMRLNAVLGVEPISNEAVNEQG